VLNWEVRDNRYRLKLHVGCHVGIQANSHPVWKSLHQGENPCDLLREMSHRAAHNRGIMETRIEVLSLDSMITSRKSILHCHIWPQPHNQPHRHQSDNGPRKELQHTIRIRRIRQTNRHSLSIPLKLVQPVQKPLQPLLNHRLQPPHTLNGEERIQRRSSHAVLLMRNRRERAVRNAKLVREPLPLVATTAGASVDLILEGGRFDVELARVDADDGAVLLVPFADLESVLAAADHVVVEFVPDGVSTASSEMQKMWFVVWVLEGIGVGIRNTRMSEPRAWVPGSWRRETGTSGRWHRQRDMRADQCSRG
jgi:hypothetical protein